MQRVAVVNQKGGVGKTSVTLGLADVATSSGQRVLVADLDPQANATYGLGVDEPARSMNDVLQSDAVGVLATAIVPSGWPSGPDVVPSTLALATQDMDNALGSEFHLHKAAEGLEGYDLVLVDCPPSLGRLVVNGLVFADLALVVTEPSAPSLQGVQRILETISVVAEHYNPGLYPAGIVVNRVPASGVEANYRLAELTELYPVLVWQPFIPQRVVVAEALGARMPLRAFGSRSRDVTAALAAILDQLRALDQEK